MPTSANPSDVCADVGIRAPILALSQQPLAKPGRVRCARGVVRVVSPHPRTSRDVPFDPLPPPSRRAKAPLRRDGGRERK